MPTDFHLPNFYKSFNNEEWLVSSGTLSGSSQPGYYGNNEYDDWLLDKLQNGQTPERAGVDQELLSNLDALNKKNIQIIYNLVPPSSGTRDPYLIKYIWETRFDNATYINELEGVSIAIKDFNAPTQKQLKLITKYAIKDLNDNKNILVHCHGGMGRTGTILAAIAMKANDLHNADEAIQYVRKYYSKYAIETTSQENSLKTFGRSLK